jgi:transposase-like protein
VSRGGIVRVRNPGDAMTFECRFTEGEIAAALEAYESGADRNELCARLGISVRTLFRWQAKAGRNRPTLLQLVGSLRDENLRLREMLQAGNNEDPAPM